MVSWLGIFTLFFFFFFKVFSGSLEAEGGTTLVAGGTVYSSSEVVEYLKVGLGTSLELDVERPSNVDSIVRA